MNERVTRIEAAERIAAAVEAGGYSASAWVPEGEAGSVRVYVTIPAANWKKRVVKIGYLEVTREGEVETHLDRQSGSIWALVPDLVITPVAPRSAEAGITAPRSADEDIAAFEASEQAVAAAEQTREQG